MLGQHLDERMLGLGRSTRLFAPLVHLPPAALDALIEEARAKISA
ncbi:hypothetical protein [Micromonospora rhizosphaerae]|nr:hypothetical protein [Micromonospora rhizosphaerae]